MKSVEAFDHTHTPPAARLLWAPLDGALRSDAQRVLVANSCDGYTKPSLSQYPHQWNWDSALNALGWVEISPERAYLELERLAGAQSPSGYLPHIAFDADSCDYFPGPEWWGRLKGADGRAISGITQPPVAATCLRLIFSRYPDPDRARPLLEVFQRYHDFLLGPRNPQGRDEPVVIHPWESGRDNSPEWDIPQARVRLRVQQLDRRDRIHVAAAQRPTDRDYRIYLSLVMAGAEVGWDQRHLACHGEFRVLDPGFSAILARACHDLAELAGRLGERSIRRRAQEHARRISRALAGREDRDGVVWPHDLVSNQTQRVLQAGSALTILDPYAGKRRLQVLRREILCGSLQSAFGVRSTQAGHPRMDPQRYWRGPCWVNVTWLCAQGLAWHGDRAGAQLLLWRIAQAVRKGGWREYFHPETGEGLGAQQFSWTAALALAPVQVPGD